MLIEGSREKMSPQDHLPKSKLCVYCSTRASRVLRVPLRLVEVRISTECWPGHPKLSKKKKRDKKRRCLKICKGEKNEIESLSQDQSKASLR